MTEKVIKGIPLVTLVGPPNSGKTTLFNLLSGKNYKTVNYPGSTVEYSTSKFLSKYNLNAALLDSPGIISLIPNSPDEKVAVDSLYLHPNIGSPHLIVNTIDASQLSRHLLLAEQLIESGFKVIIALTMNDILKKKNLEVSEKRLSDLLGCNVIKIDGRNGKGTNELIKAIDKNLDEINQNGNSVPKQYQLNEVKRRLIDSYERIEQIIDDVLIEITDNDQINLAKANEQLKIISSPYIGKKNAP